MPACPKCGVELDCLRVRLVDYGEMAVRGGKLDVEWRSDVYGPSAVEVAYLCPECGESISSSAEEAVAFLQS